MIKDRTLDKAWFIVRDSIRKDKANSVVPSLEQHKQDARNDFLKLGSLVVFFVIVMVLSFPSFSAQCTEEFYVGVSGDRPYHANYLDVTTAPEDCTSNIVMQQTEYITLKTKADLVSDTALPTALEITQSFTWGLGTYLVFWAIGFKARSAKASINAL